LLVIENDSGCSDTSFPAIITAGSLLNPDFTVSPEHVCPGEPIRLEDITVPQDSVDFRHFLSPGLFSVTLTENSAVTVDVLPATAGYKAIQFEVGTMNHFPATVPWSIPLFPMSRWPVQLFGKLMTVSFQPLIP
jgi:hypothetical protein